MNPAWTVPELNRNSELTHLAIEYADTLVKLVVLTEKGKPRRVLPGPIVYETGALRTPRALVDLVPFDLWTSVPRPSRRTASRVESPSGSA